MIKLQKLKNKYLKNEKKSLGKIKTTEEIHVEGESDCPDGGYGWIICIAAAVIQFIILGIHNNFGILYHYFMKDLKATPEEAAWIGSLAFGMNFLCGPVASTLCQRFGYRIVAAAGGLIASLGLLLTSFTGSLYVIYFTYSVLWGFGSSLNYTPTMLVLGQYFHRHLPLANGIVTAGSGIGTIAMGPFYNIILSNFGWKVMLRILSGFSFLMFVSALLYRPLPGKYKRAHNHKEEGFKLFDLSVWKIKPFVCWVVSMSFLFFGYVVPFIHLPNFARNLGIPGYQSSVLIGSLSIASTVSRVLFGLVLNHPRMNRFFVLQFCFLMMAVTTTLCPLARGYTGLTLYTVGFGIFDGCFVLLIAITTSDLVGPNRLPPALGFLYAVMSIPMICGPPFAAFLFEVSGSYHNAFFAAGAAMAFGTFTLAIMPLFQRPKIREKVEVCEGPLEQDKFVQFPADSNCTLEKQGNSFTYDTSNCIVEMVEREIEIEHERTHDVDTRAPKHAPVPRTARETSTGN